MYSSTLSRTSALDGGGGDQPHAPTASTPGKDPVPIVQEAGWAPGPVWTGVENLAPTGIRSPDRPARSQSLYCLRYPAHSVWNLQILNRVQLTLWDVSLMHVPSKSLSLISKVFEGGIWELRYAKWIQKTQGNVVDSWEQLWPWWQ